MEWPLPLQRSLSCGIVSSQGTHFRIKPFFGFLPMGPHNPLGGDLVIWQPRSHIRITASADFSRRRRGKSSTPRSKDSTPRGFGPRTQVPTSTQKKDRKNNEEKEGPGTSSQNEFGSLSADTPDPQIRSDEVETTNINLVPELDEDSDGESNGEHDVVGLEVPSTREAFPVSKMSQFEENVQISDVNKHVTESKDAERISKSEEKLAATGGVDVSVRESVIEREQINAESSNNQWQERIKKDQVGSIKTTDESHKGSSFVKPEPVDDSYTSISELKRKEDEFLKLKLESEESLREETINRLADDNFRKGNKLFYYPELVKPDQRMEIFFNRSFSTLKNEPDVMIMGAFNDWKWKSFGMKLSRSNLKGDWWSCQLYVPKEAYKIDFVFYNGKDVYENNDKQDFCIVVDGGMDVFDFENFLLEEKMREQEDLLRQKAERERQEEEQRRIEAEKAASEADRAQAKEEAAKTRGMMQVVMKKALISVDDVWYIEPKPRDVEGNEMVRLYYNRSSGPLSHAKDLWIHGGYNNWKDGLSIVSKLIKSEKYGDWWFADVVVPDRALVLDWVLADGPPQQAVVYDNNNLQDFHAIVPKSIDEELYWVEEEQIIFRRLQTERRSREEAIRAKVEKTARLKAEAKEKTLRTYLLSQKHIVYTDPLDVHAGSTVSLFYNPANTVLNGKSEVWFRCSFNRWTHRMGPLPPQKMIPAENSSHLKATVKVPLDAYMIDFVFSEREDGGIFDNKNGMDYHIPVLGGVVKEPPMHIVHVSVEMAPIAKVGGLGDVVTSLSRAVQDMNHNVEIIIPKYDCLNLSHVKDLQFHKSYSWGGTEIKVWFGKVEGLSVYFLEPQNGLFWVGCIYGRGNDGERFGFFCHAALEFLLQSGSHPDIIHCHDWSSAPVAWLFKEQYMHYGLSKARIVFTIHNLEFGAQLIGKAVAFSDKATTVSPTYSREVSGNPVIAPHLYKFHGILNGIDPDIWDPYNDKFLPVSYTSENVVEGKRAAKEALQQKLGLKKADLPMLGIITRLTHQKGIHLIKHAIWRTLERNGQVVLLGSAPDPRIQNDFVNLANQLHSSHTDRARLCLTYDEPLSHLIYAGADFILVPSIFEPCGLTQLTAMRYGSVPVVRKTGGLYDTVYDVDHDKERAQEQGLQPNGFNFDGADAGGVDYALNRAITAWYEKREWFNALCKCVMEQDWSWNRPALDYLELYNAARK
ncbi:LOW QUALITY PROTEIN: starch synthase 3, chloroplastic/amyloplastic [Salvia miltiorrhiza]|uniref:LOW QUALITY PROTEIN: starch synthase 3, chloroplastic/amyloplastic n=1 Tax=Salvia miltiorrhiza TaxID=226208 RepID=UPI0025AD5AE9|nr:LOW QUALITY PROTEIN: starch synthase 3, chloroplastic/amyloplastic [Salvia miltiorrhiza]